LSPDVIFITGDFINRNGDYNSAQEFLENLSAKYGIYAVLGNTDYTDEKWVERINNIKNIIVLQNQSVRLVLDQKRQIWIVGIDDPYTYHDDLHYTLTDVDMTIPIIILSHTPEIVREVVRIARPFLLKQGTRIIPLVLCGHTHGGQVHFPFFGPIKHEMRYIDGLSKGEVTNLFITRGVGMGSIPFRFMCRPEIAVLEFCRPKH
jgi:predicted MPP superfamily phosphohydrolase